MKVVANQSFIDQDNLLTVDSTIKFTGIGDYMFRSYPGTSIGYIDTSEVTRYREAWRTSALTSFPAIDVSGATQLRQTWQYCSSLTSFPAIDTSTITDWNNTWAQCTALTSFPFIDVSNGQGFASTWNSCSSLTSFPPLNFASATAFASTWSGCSGLTSFPLVNLNNSIADFRGAWSNCTSLVTFPANFFDSWTGTPLNYCFDNSWNNCTSLSATSVENILNSIDTSGVSAPSTGPDITIDYNASSGTPSISTAVTNLKSRGWTITLNGVAQ
jgi:hypothetical protein